jgi:hypothetical protein
LLFTITILTQCSVEPYKPIGSTTSGTYVAYNSSTTALVQGGLGTTYIITYLTPKPSNPKLIISLIGY